MTITFNAMEFTSATAALQHYDASGYGDAVITLGGKYYLVKQSEVDRLAAAGVEFAYVHDHQMPDGTQRIMTVPVN